MLTRCFELTGDQRLPEAISTAGYWITQRLTSQANRFHSLYFGEAGIAWALYEAGRGWETTCWPSKASPCFLHFWLRTGNKEFAERASKAADELVTTAVVESTGASWSAPAEFDSRFAGGRFLGFSHGLAGVGQFLLMMALTTGRSDCLELAIRAGETLLANVSLVQDAAIWGRALAMRRQPRTGATDRRVSETSSSVRQT